MKKRRAHIAGDHASELFNPLLFSPSSPLQKTTHPRRATRLDYACFTVHYNITLILHDKPLIFYKRPPPIWGEAGRNLPERVAIRGEKSVQPPLEGTIYHSILPSSFHSCHLRPTIFHSIFPSLRIVHCSTCRFSPPLHLSSHTPLSLYPIPLSLDVETAVH